MMQDYGVLTDANNSLTLIAAVYHCRHGAVQCLLVYISAGTLSE